MGGRPGSVEGRRSDSETGSQSWMESRIPAPVTCEMGRLPPSNILGEWDSQPSSSIAHDCCALGQSWVQPLPTLKLPPPLPFLPP